MKTRLLVVDDAPFIQESIRGAFRDTEIEVIGFAFDGIEAIQMTRKLNPDVVLMDIALPKKNGIQATREIIRKAPDTRIIACSSLDDESMMMKAIEAGCSEFISKPFSRDRLLESVRAAAGMGLIFEKKSTNLGGALG